MKRAVFLDRDGVINEAVVVDGKPYPPAGLNQLKILPGVQDSLKKLKHIGFFTLVVTNQPDVARGKATRESVQKIHGHLAKELALDGFYTCWHDDKDGCDCRKPKPGLLRKAATDHEIELSQSFMVGDRWRDVEAGRAAGCRTIFLDYGYREKKPENPDFTCGNLQQAVDWILQKEIKK